MFPLSTFSTILLTFAGRAMISFTVDLAVSNMLSEIL